MLFSGSAMISPITTIVNVNNSEYDVYIERGSQFGNPFKIGVHGSRKEVILKYKEWLYNNSKLFNEIDKLSGKVLGCH